VADPKSVCFKVDGQPVKAVEFQTADPITSSYQFTFQLPVLTVGNHTLNTHVGSVELPSIQIEIEKVAK
jgi:hypothetical protein